MSRTSTVDTVMQHALRVCHAPPAAERATCFVGRNVHHWTDGLEQADAIYDKLTEEEIAEWRECFQLFSAPKRCRSVLYSLMGRSSVQRQSGLPTPDQKWLLDDAVGQQLRIQAEAEADSRQAPMQLRRVRPDRWLSFPGLTNCRWCCFQCPCAH